MVTLTVKKIWANAYDLTLSIRNVEPTIDVLRCTSFEVAQSRAEEMKAALLAESADVRIIVVRE